jgi:hypothetical protein
METVIEFTTKFTMAEDLESITNFIHDSFFELDNIQFNFSKKLLIIPFVREFYDLHEPISHSLLGKVNIPSFNSFLKIPNALSYTITDTEEVGSYDFESISFDTSKNSLRINTNITLSFEIIVSNFEIIITRDECPVNFRKSSIFGL